MENWSIKIIMQTDANKSIKKGPSTYTKSQFITVITKALDFLKFSPWTWVISGGIQSDVDLVI